MKNETPVAQSFFDKEKDEKTSNNKGIMLAKEHLELVVTPPNIQGDLFEVQTDIKNHYNDSIPNIEYLLNIGDVSTKHGLHLQGIEQTIHAVLYIKAFKENNAEIYNIKKDCPYIRNIDRSIDYQRGIRIKTAIKITKLTEEIFGYKNARLCSEVEKSLMRMLNRWITMPKTNRPDEKKWVTFQPIMGVWETNTETKERTIYIEFSKLYTFNVHHNFIWYPENIVPFHRYIISQYINSGFEINIFNLLYKIIHYVEKGTTNPFRIEKKKLYDTVISFEKEKKSFSRNPQRRENRFRILINKFVNVGFLLIGTHTDQNGKEIEDFGYWETQNDNGFTICNFRLNFDFVNILNSNEILKIIHDERRKKLQ